MIVLQIYDFSNFKWKMTIDEEIFIIIFRLPCSRLYWRYNAWLAMNIFKVISNVCIWEIRLRKIEVTLDRGCKFQFKYWLRLRYELPCRNNYGETSSNERKRSKSFWLYNSIVIISWILKSFSRWTWWTKRDFQSNKSLL